MIIKKSLGEKVFDGFNHLLLIVLMFTMAFPLLHVVALSFSNPGAIEANRVSWYPVGFNLVGYEQIISYYGMWRSYLNSVLYAVGAAFMSLLLTSLLAYPLSVQNFIFRKPLLKCVLITMFFNGGLIATYLTIRNLGLVDKFWVMVLPGAVGGYQVVMFRTFFQQLPGELRESALMDGANDLRILFGIILPLSKPMLATFGLFTIVNSWNDWFGANLYLQSDWKMPLQIILRRLVVLNRINQGLGTNSYMALIEANKMHPKNMQMAIVVVAMFPILCIYPFVQKFFVKGVMMGSVKG